jgi:hypothetical protein
VFCSRLHYRLTDGDEHEADFATAFRDMAEGWGKLTYLAAIRIKTRRGIRSWSFILVAN